MECSADRLGKDLDSNRGDELKRLDTANSCFKEEPEDEDEYNLTVGNNAQQKE